VGLRRPALRKEPGAVDTGFRETRELVPYNRHGQGRQRQLALPVPFALNKDEDAGGHGDDEATVRRDDGHGRGDETGSRGDAAGIDGLDSLNAEAEGRGLNGDRLRNRVVEQRADLADIGAAGGDGSLSGGASFQQAL
jgi:hypothetical protein